MIRWAFAGLTAAILTQSAAGQNLWPNGVKPAAPAAPAAVEERIVTMRTAGQPDRRVKVLRTETLPDGSQFTELKDLTTGAVYSIMGPPPAADPFPATATTAPGEKLVPVNEAGLPQAKPRPADPLLGAQANLGTKSTAVAAAASTAKPVVALPQQSRLAATLFGAGTPTPPATLVPPQVVKKPVPQPTGQRVAARPEPKQSAFAKAVFGEWPQAAPPVRVQPLTTAVPPRPNPTTVAAKPTPAAARKPEFSAPVVAVAPRSPESSPPVLAAPPRTAPVEVVAARPTPPAAPVEVAAAKPTAPTVLAALPGTPVAPAVVAKPAVVAAPVEAPASALVAATVTPAKVLEAGPDSAPTITQVSASVESETIGLLHQLANHTKPSGRIAAAMALAELPTVSRPEVVQALVAAAETDTVGVVRGNCILLLNAMGYAHPEYVAMLRGWEADEEPAVRTAVRVALAKVR